MAVCPMCQGEGEMDNRTDDAWWSEHHTDAELAYMRSKGLRHPAGVIPCDECDATGVVSEERAGDLTAYARAAVDQVIAKMTEEGRWPAHEAR